MLPCKHLIIQTALIFFSSYFSNLVYNSRKRLTIFSIKGTCQNLQFLNTADISFHSRRTGINIIYRNTINQIFYLTDPTATKMPIHNTSLKVNDRLNILDRHH